MKKMRNDYVVDVSSVSSHKNLTLADLKMEPSLWAKTIQKWDKKLRNGKSNNFWKSEVRAKDDALAFLKAVETSFQDQTEKYSMFLDLLLQFHRKRVQVEEVIATVKELFQGYNDLICGFNTFLPKGQEISQITIDDEKDSEIQRAMAFIANVKERLQTEERYRTFLDIMVEYQRGEDIALEVFNEVTDLLNGHQDLIEEFTTFFPDVRGP